MKLKLIAAAALAAVTLPSFAAIAPGSTGNGELFVVVQDSTAQISYTLDLGVTMDSFFVTGQQAEGYSFTWNLSDAQFTSFLGQTDAANYKWAVLAVDSFGAAIQNQQRLFTTTTIGTTDTTIQSMTNTNLRSGIGNTSFANFLNAVNTSGTHGVAGVQLDYAVNGSSVNVITDSGASYFGEGGGTGPRLQGNVAPFSNTNDVGVASFFYQVASSATTGNVGLAGFDQFNNAENSGSFLLSSGPSGYSLTYSIAPVPEPTGLALLLAGLGAVGFVGRRRQPR